MKSLERIHTANYGKAEKIQPKEREDQSKGDKLESPKVEKKILNLESRIHLQTRIFVYFGHLNPRTNVLSFVPKANGLREI